MEAGNLYHHIPTDLPAEITEQLVRSDRVRIERIVSKGHHSAPDFWYDQDECEWVLLVKGEARLRFEEGDRTVHLTEGMHVNIPAHARHRVEWTRPDTETIWLAVFY
jgi:cupin 2 domain-containing protein